ncbi:MAG: type II toxin-antitoxin system RelE/ParE family toxin [Terriglobia bacterium]|jgi:phage-related protein
MPKTEVVVFAAEDGSAPLLAWMDNLQVKVRDKCIVRIERLAEVGHELRRPEADFLQDGIHELRIQHKKVQYRILYFFHEGLAVLSHGCTKESIVPPVEIGRAVKNRERFIQDPSRHIYKE